MRFSDEQLSLHLAFYLASWGMYRGSSKLLQKDHLVHLGAVKILREYICLRSEKGNEIKAGEIENILALVEDLKSNYLSHGVTPTKTLMSKIMLGALGSLPAFDRYFIKGVKKENRDFKNLSAKSLLGLFQFVQDTEQELCEIQVSELSESGIFYPKMKLVDMYFWERGYTEGGDMD